MNVLSDILFEMIMEIGDEGKPYEFSSVGTTNHPRYKFTTDAGDEYVVALDFTNYKGGEKDAQVEFYVTSADKKGAKPNQYRAMNNIKEFYRVMSTIISCVKDSYGKEKFDYISYYPMGSKSSTSKKDTIEIGTSQRDKLYRYYIKKYFPRAHFADNDGQIIAVLNDE